MKQLKENSVGARIRASRKKLGLTQKQLAELVGTSQQLLQRYEAGSTADSRLNRENYLKMARCLKVSFHWLLTGIHDDEEMTNLSIPVLTWSNLKNWLNTTDRDLVTEWLPLPRAHFNEQSLGVILESDTLEFKTTDIVIINTSMAPRDGDYVIVNFSEASASFLCIMVYGTSLTAVSSLEVIGVFTGVYSQLR